MFITGHNGHFKEPHSYFVLLHSAPVDRGDLCKECWTKACFAGREREGRGAGADNSSTACLSIAKPQEVKCPGREQRSQIGCHYFSQSDLHIYRHKLSTSLLSHTLTFHIHPSSPLSLLSSIRLVLDRGYPMLLCAVASDSTLVYQRMTDGLVTPDPPVGPFEDMGRRQHRKRRREQQSWSAGVMMLPTGVDGQSMNQLRQLLCLCCA